MNDMSHLRNIEAAPDWLRDECLQFLTRFGFDSWQIKVFICDTPEVDGRKMKGQAYPDSAYLRGHIYFSRDITPADLHHIYHECLHMVFSELEHTIDYSIIGALSEGLDKFYQGLYIWHFERLIERMARAFADGQVVSEEPGAAQVEGE